MTRWRLLPLFVALMMAVPAQASEIPSSSRARQAIHRIRPLLEKELHAKDLQWGAPVFIRIFKAQKRLQVWLRDGRCYKLFDTFDICTYGREGLGPKTSEGDGRAPEGFYYVTPRQLNPYSRYHLAFNLGYPNRYDRAHGRTGSALMVHGSCISIGCFAMTDACMDRIYALADAAFRNGQPFFRVHIFPFSMTEEKMARYSDPEHAALMAKWSGFWEELKAGYNYFERHRRPPDVTVKNGFYLFSEAH